MGDGNEGKNPVKDTLVDIVLAVGKVIIDTIADKRKR